VAQGGQTIFVVQKNVVEELENRVSSGRHTVMLDNCSHLLNYISDIIITLKYGSGRWGIPSGVDRSNSPTPDSERMDDLSWTEEVPEDDESGGDDSDDEALDGKLCTYIQTVSVHEPVLVPLTPVEGVGCCSVCARVCHRDHDRHVQQAWQLLL
jgi:E3 ubiquitin-protein ligase UBR4